MFFKRLSGKCRWKLLLAVFLFPALSACDQDGSNYQQAKTPPDGGPWADIQPQETFSFVVIGDTRTGIAVFKQHIEEINLLAPDCVIDIGDLINGYVDEVQKIEAMWDEFDAIVKGFNVPLVMVPGNHDIWSPNSAEIYRRRYGKTYFSFSHKGVHFVCLDSETLGEDGKHINRIGGDQLEWLANDLAKNKDAKATFVFLHKPFWQNHHTGKGSGKRWMEDVHPILAKHGVSAVFAGHVHKYMSFPVVDGVHYYITGGGGVGIGNDESAGDFHHYCLIKVRGHQWQMAVIRSGAVKADTVVNNDRMILPQIVSFAPIEVPANGGQTVIDVSLRNFLSEDVAVTIKPVIAASSQWRIEPGVQEGLLKVSGPAQARRFVATVPSCEQVYPSPWFSITFTREGLEPIIISVRPPVKPFVLAQCPAVAEPPVIDGKLDDDVWQSIPVFSKFFTADASRPAKFATQVRSSHDRENLYLSFRCHEPNLSGLVINVNDRDGSVWGDDSLEIFLDTNLDRKTYFQLVFNPAAVAYDGIGSSRQWNGLFAAKVGREARAWTLEVAVPWATLQMEPPTPGQQIGLEVVRNRAQSGEHTQWSPTYGHNHLPEQYGTLTIGP